MATPAETKPATQNVLLTGANSAIGNRIGTHLVGRADARVRLLLGSSIGGSLGAAVRQLLEQGAELVECDLADARSLSRATSGIDVVVSAAEGGTELDSHSRLAEAARHNGARRILHEGLRLSHAETWPAAREVPALRPLGCAAAGLQHVFILHGAFMEMFGPGSSLLDYRRAVARYWGDENRPLDVTSMDDTARMIARAALDLDLPSGTLCFAGDRVSFAQAAAVAAAHAGCRFDLHRLGSALDLERAVVDAASADPAGAAMMAGLLQAMSSRSGCGDPQRLRYPDICLESLADFLAHRLSLDAEAALPLSIASNALSGSCCEIFKTWVKRRR